MKKVSPNLKQFKEQPLSAQTFGTTASHQSWNLTINTLTWRFFLFSRLWRYSPPSMNLRTCGPCPSAPPWLLIIKPNMIINENTARSRTRTRLARSSSGICRLHRCSTYPHPSLLFSSSYPRIPFCASRNHLDIQYLANTISPFLFREVFSSLV